jgi:predicted secreted protein
VTVAGALAVYFVIWWTVLFAVLPFGVRSQAETGEITQGTEPGAPALPGLLRKALITTAIAAVVFVIVWYVWATFEL